MTVERSRVRGCLDARGCAGARVRGCERPRDASVLPLSFRSVLPLSFRASAASRGIWSSLRRDLRARIFTQRRRGAQRRRELLSGARSSGRCQAHLHLRHQEKDWGWHSAVRGGAALLGPPHAPRLRVRCSAQEQRQQRLTRRRGELLSGSGTLRRRSASPSATPGAETLGSAFRTERRSGATMRQNR